MSWMPAYNAGMWAELFDYRSRISVQVWAITAVLALGQLIELPGWDFEWYALGSPIGLSISGTIVLSGLVALMAASATETIAQAHPLAWEGRLRGSWSLYALPCALVIVAALVLPLASTRLYLVAGLALTAGILALTFIAMYHSIDGSMSGYRASRIFLNLLTYATVLLLFLLVYQTRSRSLLSATLIAATSALLALELLRDTGQPFRILALYAGIAGALLGQLTWALNYWQLPSPLTGGAGLLLAFYLIVGLSIQGLRNQLTGRVVLEFALLLILGLLLIGFLAL